MRGAVQSLDEARAMRLTTPVEVSLWTTQTALMARAESDESSLGSRAGIGPVAPVAGNEIHDQSETLRHLLPQRREVAASRTSVTVAGRQGVDQRGLPGAGTRRREHNDRSVGLKDRLQRSEDGGGQARKTLHRGDRWLVATSRAERARARLSAREFAGSVGPARQQVPVFRSILRTSCCITASKRRWRCGCNRCARAAEPYRADCRAKINDDAHQNIARMMAANIAVYVTLVTQSRLKPS